MTFNNFYNSSYGYSAFEDILSDVSSVQKKSLKARSAKNLNNCGKITKDNSSKLQIETDLEIDNSSYCDEEEISQEFDFEIEFAPLDEVDVKINITKRKKYLPKFEDFEDLFD